MVLISLFVLILIYFVLFLSLLFYSGDGYFKDSDHPSRKRLLVNEVEELNFSYRVDSKNEDVNEVCTLKDVYLKEKYRNWQLAHQMHTCTKSCWKYCQSGEKICRYKFPFSMEEYKSAETNIEEQLDYNKRKIVKVHPPRNNGNINAHAR